MGPGGRPRDPPGPAAQDGQSPPRLQELPPWPKNRSPPTASALSKMVASVMVPSEVALVKALSQHGDTVGPLPAPRPLIFGPPIRKAPPVAKLGPPPLNAPPGKAPPDDTVGPPPPKAPPDDTGLPSPRGLWLQRLTDAHRVKEPSAMVRPVQAPPVKALSQHGEVDLDGIPIRSPPLQAPPDDRPPLKAHPVQAAPLKAAPAKKPPPPLPFHPAPAKKPPPPLPRHAITPSVLEAWEMFEMVNMEPHGYDRRGWMTVVTSRQGLTVPTPYYQKSFFFWNFRIANECAERWRQRGFRAEVDPHEPYFCQVLRNVRESQALSQWR